MQKQGWVSINCMESLHIIVSKSENHRTRFPAVQHSFSFEYSRINTRGNMLGHKHHNTNCSMQHVTGMSANKSKLAIKLDTVHYSLHWSPHTKCTNTISLACKTQCKLRQSSKRRAVQVHKSCEGWSIWRWRCTTKVEIRQGCQKYTKNNSQQTSNANQYLICEGESMVLHARTPAEISQHYHSCPSPSAHHLQSLGFWFVGCRRHSVREQGNEDNNRALLYIECSFSIFRIHQQPMKNWCNRRNNNMP